jgi:DNA (cytosine-5)-methyltransferase 1
VEAMKQPMLFQEMSDSDNSWFGDMLKKLSVQESSGWSDVFGHLLLECIKVSNNKPIRTLSLFSGAGGLDIGFHDAGFNIIECNELEKDFAKTLIENSKKGKRLEGAKVICTDICEYSPKLKNIDFIIGGPPCQTFSAAGARAAGVNGIDDDRGNLFKQYVRILKQLKPKGFLFENVYRIVGAQGGKPWQLIQEAFKEAGYKLFWKILDAADYGVPQFRERLFIVGLREGEFRFPFPTHGPDSQDRRAYFSAEEAITGVVSKEPGKPINGRHGHLLNDIPPGLNYSFYTEKMGHPTPYFGWRSKFSDYLYKADPKTPVRTIKAQGGQYTGPFHWDNRAFTIEELKRLQTFPDDYIVLGNRQKVIHQLGNSVPPQLARILAISIAVQIFGVRLPFEIKFMPDNYKLGFRSRKSRLTKVYRQKAKEAISKIKNSNKTICRDNEERMFLYDLDDSLELRDASSKKYEFRIIQVILNDSIKILLHDNNHEVQESVYKYTIVPKTITNNAFIDNIELISYSQDKRSITAIWKHLEYILKLKAHKDDLVQFFGYYQYPVKHFIGIDIRDEKHHDPFWRTLQCISTGLLVGKIVEIEELSRSYNISVSVLFEQLKLLKQLGFEIRNSNTNRQIRDNSILIPYRFPTLNKRSLQRLKEL